MNNMAETMGDRIRKRRIEMGLSQERLAELVCIHRISLIRYERDEQALPADIAGRLSEILNTTLDYLILGKETKVSEERWYHEMMNTLSRIHDPALQKIALAQLKCFIL